MSERRRRLRSALRWLLTVAIVLYAVTDWGDDDHVHRTAEPAEETPTGSFHITSISDADVNPGDAVIVGIDGADPGQPVGARLAGKPADVLVRAPSSIVVRIPPDLGYGRAGLRIVQGERKSKAWDLNVRPANTRKLIGRLLGGLALFVYGLTLLAFGMRGLAGEGIRSLLGRLVRAPPQAVGVGVLVGSVTQLTTSAAALAVSLVDARLVALAPTIAIFVGAQLGASITGALLPVGLSHEALIVIAIGVVWTRLATGRRARAVAQLVLGAGLMLYGLHLLQTSVEPLVGDPQILPYVGYLRADGWLPLVTCAATGALLALVLQGPGPVYVLVVGLAQASNTLPLDNALAILAGTNLGAAIGMALVAWQSGQATRPLVRPHLMFGAAATVFALVSLPVWTALANAIVGDPGGAVDYGHTVVLPSLSTRLAIGFAATQLAAVLAWLAVLPALTRRAHRRRAPLDTASPSLTGDALVLASQRELARTLEQQSRALNIGLATTCNGDRAGAAVAEEALVGSRRMLDLQYTGLAAAANEPNAAVDRVTRATVACLQLQRVVEQLVDVAELGVERGLRLNSDEQTRLRAMHQLAQESFTAIAQALDRGAPLDVEAAGAREIRMNVLEAEARGVVSAAPRSARDTGPVHLGIAELVDCYEHVGNHLFRVAKALSDDADDLP